MSDPYAAAKSGRLTFKGGGVATVSKSIHKNKNKKKQKNQQKNNEEPAPVQVETAETAAENIYTIDAAKKMNYEELFPVEAKKFSYHKPKETTFSSVEDALDDRVKKKADRYCK